MQSLSAYFETDKPLAFTILFAALLVLIIVLFLLYRLVFGRRVKPAAGGRARQPRLGIVDAFDLDRQRQLVLVRRDNVEHLIMIGGPNDVVLESSIVRTTSVATLSPGREKDAAIAAAAPQIPAATPLAVTPQPSPSLAPPPPSSVAPPARSSPVSGSPALPPPAPDRTPARPASSDEAPPAAEARTVQPPPPRVAPPSPTPAPRPAPSAAPAPLPPRNPAMPLPPRPALTPRPSSLPPRPPLPPRTPATPLPPRPAPTPSTSAPSTPMPPAPMPPAPETGRGEPPTLGGVIPGNTSMASDNAPPLGGVGGERLSAAEMSPAASAPRLDPGQPKGFESIESLEEEMAKLLGRGTPRRDG